MIYINIHRGRAFRTVVGFWIVALFVVGTSCAQPGISDFGITHPDQIVPTSGPLTVGLDEGFRLWYNVTNPPPNNIILGASLQKQGSPEILSDPSNDKTIPSPSSDWHWRLFKINNSYQSGIYDVYFGLWNADMTNQYYQTMKSGWLVINTYSYNVHLTSLTDDGIIDSGSIEVGTGTYEVDRVTYNLPNEISKQYRLTKYYWVYANAPSGYNFDHWETSGGVGISQFNNGGYEKISVTSDGILKAHFKKGPTFDLNIIPESMVLNPGGKGSVDFVVTSKNGYTGDVEVNLGYGNVPSSWISNVVFSPSKITLSSGGTQTVTVSFDLSGSATPGSFVMRATAYNNIKNINKFKDIPLVIQTPPILKVSINSPTTDGYFPFGDPITFTANRQGGTPPYTFEWKDEKGNVITTESFSKSDFEPGAHRVELVVMDANLKTANASVDFFVVEPFRFVHLTDVHIGPDPECLGYGIEGGATYEEQRLAAKKCIDTYDESITRFNGVIVDIMNNTPDFVIITGDLIQWNDKNLYETFISIISKLEKNNIQVYIVPGNHDRRGERNPKNIWYALCPLDICQTDNLDNYRNYIGSRTIGGISVDYKNANYYFDHKGYRFIGLDSGSDFNATEINCNWPDKLDFDHWNKFKVSSCWDFTPEGSGLGFDQEIALDLASNDFWGDDPNSNSPKIVFMHHPAIQTKDDLTGFPPVINEDNTYGGNDGTIANKRAWFVKYTDEHSIKLVLTGHTHTSKFLDNHGKEIYGEGRNTKRPLFIQTKSVAGQGGYLIIDVDSKGTKVTPCTAPCIIEKPSMTNHIAETIESPADIHIFDEFGRHTGLNATGEIETNIPDSYYIGDFKIGNITLPATILLYNTTLNYTTKLISNFSKESVTGEQSNFTFIIERQTSNETTIVSYDNVTIYRNSSASVKINAMQTNYTMAVDLNNDSENDATKIPDTIKTDQAPQAVILLPSNGSYWDQGQPITFNGAGIDMEDGMLNHTVWISNRDDVIGYGNFTTSNLSAGEHRITLRVNDSIGQINTSIIVLFVNDTQPPVLEVDNLAENKIFSRKNITVTGIAYDDSGILEVKVNNVNAGQENWKTIVQLNEGANIIEVVATDNKGFSTTVTRKVYYDSSLISDDEPPYLPNAPIPENLTVDELINTNLSWNGGDPDGDSVTYSVYMGTNINPSTQVCTLSSTLILNTCNILNLSHNTAYYWKVVAIDNKSASTTGPVWSFTTEPAPELNLVSDENSKVYRWDAQNLPGFWYDLESGLTSEKLIIDSSELLASSDRNIDAGNLRYITSRQIESYNVYESKNVTVENALDSYGNKVANGGHYAVIGWNGDRYIAVNGKANKLSKLIMSQGSAYADKKTLEVGEIWEIGEGYTLTVNSINALSWPRQVNLTLRLNGNKIDEKIVEHGAVYTYSKNLAGESSVPIFVTYVDVIFNGATSEMVQLRYSWFISSSVLNINSGDIFGNMNVTSASDRRLTLKNTNAMYMSGGSVFSIFGNISFKIADNISELRFYPVVNTVMQDRYETRGTIFDEAMPVYNEMNTWNASNFQGFWYDLDTNTATEELRINQPLNSFSPYINTENLIYSTHAVRMTSKNPEISEYYAIGWQGDEFAPLYSYDKFGNTVSSPVIGKISRWFMDNGNNSLNSGEIWDIGNGYTLTPTNINGNTVSISLKKDGTQVYSTSITPGASADVGTHTMLYTKNIMGVNDVPIFSAYITISGSKVDITHAYLLSDYPVEITPGDQIGILKAVVVLDTDIVLTNMDNTIVLARDSTIDILGNLGFRVADSDKLRFYPFISKNKNISPPEIEIVYPKKDSSFLHGDMILLSARVTGCPSPYNYTWISSIDGLIGHNSRISSFSLSPGTHIISLTVKDANGLINTSSVDIEIKPVATINISGGSAADIMNWDVSNFPGFWQKNGQSSEMLRVTNLNDRIIGYGGLSYNTSRQLIQYEVYSERGKTVEYGLDSNGFVSYFGSYYAMLGLFGRPYVAIHGKPNKLTKLLFEQNTSEDKIINIGESWNLGDGYSLTLQSIDSNAWPEAALFMLNKSGELLDENVISNGSAYSYVARSIGGEYNVPMFVTYLDSVSESAVRLKYTWLISDNILELRAGDNIGLLMLDQIDWQGNMILHNWDSNIILTKGYTVNIADGMRFRINNTPWLEYYPEITVINKILPPNDYIPPASVTNLTNISFSQNYINWTWTDPDNPDFSHVMVYRDGIFQKNVEKGIQFYNAIGLSANNTHIVGTRTVDIYGNINQTWVNHTSTTAVYSYTPEKEWNRTYGVTGFNDIATSVQQTSDGGYILAGKTRSLISWHDDAWLVKTDSNGIEQWNKTFGGIGNDIANSVQKTSDGGYILAGKKQAFLGINDYAWLIKIDSNGIEQWNKTFGETGYDMANSVQQTSDGGYVFAGKTTSNGADQAWLVKIDESGIKQWNKTFGGGIANSVQQTSEGGYIMAGLTSSYGAGDMDAWLIKTDSSGNEQWNKTFGEVGFDFANSVQQTSGGGYIIAGKIQSSSVNDDAWLIKTDANGVIIWNKKFGGGGNDIANSVQQTSDGGYILAGKTRSIFSWDDDAWLIKTDANGNRRWSKTFGGSGNDIANSVQQTSKGGYILAGKTRSLLSWDDDAWLIKVLSGDEINYTVHNLNKGTNYTFIQDAIDDALSGDEIHVENGIYYETVNVTSSLVLIGEENSGKKPVIFGNDGMDTITLNSNWTVIKGFNLTHTNSFGLFGLNVKSNNNFISDNNAKINLMSANNNTIQRNNGSIYLSNSNNNTLSENNALSDSFQNGIDLYYSENNTLNHNKANSNGQSGIGLFFSKNNILNRNIFYNSYYGIRIDFSNNNQILNNDILNNQVGIQSESSEDNNIVSNNASENNLLGIYFLNSNNNDIYDNFFNNTNNFLFFNSSNTWNTIKTSSTNIIGGIFLAGNVWANPDGTDYSQTCKDDDTDGICDSSYTIDRNNTDYLPLVYRSDIKPPETITNLTNKSYATNYINWTWTTPTDPNFSHVMLYLNGTFIDNVSATQNYYNVTGLTPDTEYELSTHTVDTSGNVNQTWVNKTSRTAPMDVTLVVNFPGMTDPPTDPDGDGLFEDINGNGWKDFNDVVVIFNSLEWVAGHEPISGFDFNENGRIDFNDIVRMFEEL